MEALDLLTYDCWMEVLLRLKDPEDLKNCSEACLTFQDILRKKKNQFMFSLILPHVVGYLAEDFVDEDGDEELQWNALLKCRLVCKSWRKSVDEYSGDAFAGAYIFESGEKTKQFLQKFANHNGNPFLGRKVVLPLFSPLLLAGNQAEGPIAHGDPDDSFHVSMLRQLLERFGREIWEADLLDVERSTHMAFCKNLQTILSHLSDLRTLTVYSQLNVEIITEFNQEEQAELASYITANPLPDLPQLEHLETHDVSVMMTRPLLEKYTLQLTSLAVSDPSGFPEQCLQICNLQELTFYHLDASTSLSFLGQLRSPLRSLELNVVRNDNNIDLWAIDTLFRNIRHLPIQELDINIRNVFVGESGAIAAEDRPFHESISSLNLTFHGGSASMNFLLYCPMMEDLVLLRGPPRQGIPAGHPNGVAESLDVNDLLEQVDYDLYDSTIWEHLPALSFLTLKNYVGVGGDGNALDDLSWKWDDYERAEYERRKLEKGEVVG